jgi:hypothetical protein
MADKAAQGCNRWVKRSGKDLGCLSRNCFHILSNRVSEINRFGICLSSFEKQPNNSQPVPHPLCEKVLYAHKNIALNLFGTKVKLNILIWA